MRRRTNGSMLWRRPNESRAQLPVFEGEHISAPDDAPSDKAACPDPYRCQITQWYPPQLLQDFAVSQYPKSNGKGDHAPHNQCERQQGPGPCGERRDYNAKHCPRNSVREDQAGVTPRPRISDAARPSQLMP